MKRIDKEDGNHEEAEYCILEKEQPQAILQKQPNQDQWRDYLN